MKREINKLEDESQTQSKTPTVHHVLCHNMLLLCPAVNIPGCRWGTRVTKAVQTEGQTLTTIRKEIVASTRTKMERNENWLRKETDTNVLVQSRPYQHDCETEPGTFTLDPRTIFVWSRRTQNPRDWEKTVVVFRIRQSQHKRWIGTVAKMTMINLQHRFK
jgi:hypothetical protein